MNVIFQPNQKWPRTFLFEIFLIKPVPNDLLGYPEFLQVMATSVELLYQSNPHRLPGVRPPKATFRLKNIETDGKAISWDFLLCGMGFWQKMDRSMMDALKHVYVDIYIDV